MVDRDSDPSVPVLHEAVGSLSANSLVNDLAGLGKVGQAIVHAVRDGIGTIYRPVAIRKEGMASVEVEAYRRERLAQADSNAIAIREEGESTLRERVLARMESRELRKQHNIDVAVRDALSLASQLPADDMGRSPAEDWMEKYLDFVSDVSDDRVRQIWSEILSRQCSSNHAQISLITLDAMRLLEPRHAKLLLQLCRVNATFGKSPVFLDLETNDLDELATQLAQTAPPKGRGLPGTHVWDEPFEVLQELRLVELHAQGMPTHPMLIPVGRNHIRLSVPQNRMTQFFWVDLTVRGRELARVILKLERSDESQKELSFLTRDNLFRFMPPQEHRRVLKFFLNRWLNSGFQVEVGVFQLPETFIGGQTAGLGQQMYFDWNGETLMTKKGVTIDAEGELDEGWRQLL